MPKSKPWSEEEAAIAARMREAHSTYAEIGARLGRSSNSVEHALRSRNVKLPEVPKFDPRDVADPTDVQVLRLEREKLELQQRVKELNAKLTATHREQGLFQELAQVIRTTSVPLPPARPVKLASKDNVTPCDMVLILSDEHADEVVTRQVSWGLEEYNFNIFRVRLQRLCDLIVEYSTVHLPRHHFERLWIFKLGDGVNGDIHGHGPRNHFRNTIKAALALGDTEAQFVHALLPHFEHGVHVVGVPGNHPRRCLDEATEVLTRRGWLCYQNLQDTDEVFGINPVHDRGEWMPIEAIHVYDGPESLVGLHTRNLNFAVTAEHRFMFRTTTSSRYRFAAVGDLPPGCKIPVSVPSPATECDLSEAQIRLAAWLLTDGHFNNPKYRYVAFTQRESNKHKITNLLDALGLPYGETAAKKRDVRIRNKMVYAESQETSFEIRVHAEGSRCIREWISAKGVLPSWAWEMSDAQFGWFLDSLVDGDGTWRTATKSSAIIYGKGPLIDELQALCIQHGWMASVREDRRWPGNRRLMVSHRRFVQPCAPTEKLPYTGKVWCLTTRYGNFLVRRAGNAHFTGNSAKKDYDGPNDNFDYLVGTQMASRLAGAIDEGRASVTLPEAWSAYVRVRNGLWALNHGDDTTSYTGLPWVGFDRRNNRVQTALQSLKEHAHFFAYGHYHTPASFLSAGAKSIHSGPWCAADTYALNRLAATTEPQQDLHVIDDKEGTRGLILPVPIYVRDPEREHAYQNGAYDPSLGRHLVLDVVQPKLVEGLQIVQAS